MYLTNSLLTLLASTTLLSLVTSNPIDSQPLAARYEEGAKLVAHCTDFDKQVQRPDAAWHSLLQMSSHDHDQSHVTTYPDSVFFFPRASLILPHHRF